MRAEDEKERREGGDGATRDLRDHAVGLATRWAMLESSAAEGSCNGGWAVDSVVGVLGGVRDEASPSSWRER